MIKAGLNAELDGQAGIQELAGDATTSGMRQPSSSKTKWALPMMTFLPSTILEMPWAKMCIRDRKYTKYSCEASPCPAKKLRGDLNGGSVSWYPGRFQEVS